MTERKNEHLYKLALLFIALFLIVFSFFNLEEMLAFSERGMRVCVRSVFPSLFPFMIFSEMLLYSDIFEKIPIFLRKSFEKAFKIRQSGMGAFLTGAICGFPLGVKYATDIYGRSEINKDELERLICFCNNTGPAFVIAGIGISIRGSVKEGALLYLIQILSAVIVGLILSRNKKIEISDVAIKESEDSSFSLVEAIKKSALNMLYICAFVMFFSILCGYLHIIFRNDIPCAIISSFFEIGNASVACNKIANRGLSFILTAGAVSFSGLSVHLQAEIFYGKYNISKRKYYTAKLIQSSFSMLIAYFISLLIF